ncbi:MAG: 2-oxo acid dehydrogenase subunit E2 [Bacteroidales bacterium]|nr:2-oxo acid dehydrogenase subunit E2 [Bacteroidales bacterium]
MIKDKGYKSLPLTCNRRAVIASATVTKEKNTIHSFSEVDITEPRKKITRQFEKTGKKLSLTAYIVSCLAQTIKEYPEFNSFIKGRKLIVLEDITISVLVERDIQGEKVPEPIGIKRAQEKSPNQIQTEIKTAKEQISDKLGSLSGKTWLNLIPTFLLKTFIRIADKNIRMSKSYGKVAVTSVGMFSKEAVWFIPHGSATVLITVGSIGSKVVEINRKFVSREHLCLTASFDHAIIDGAPASRFMNKLLETIKSGHLINDKTD